MKKACRTIFLILLVQLTVVPAALGREDVPTRKVLDNGMTVILLENHNAPVVTIQAWVRAGTVTEGRFIGSGISHFVEHMLFKGTERRSLGQIGQEVKEAGGRTNAYTGYDKTVYFITFHSDHFDKSLDILGDVLMNSVFDPGEVENEREVIIKEIKMNRDAPFRRLYTTAQLTAYAVHPYGNPVIGYESLLRKISRDDLIAYYKSLYVPNNMAFIAVGDFDSREAFRKIEDTFRDFQRKSIAPAAVPQEPPQEGPRESVERFEVTVGQSMMGFHGPSIFSEDMYPMDVLAIILGGGNTSRLYQELREKRGIVYSIDAWSATPKDPGMFWISSSFEPENYEAVKEAIGEQLEKIKTEEVTGRELETARAKVLSDYLFSRESVEGQARSLGSGELEAHDMNFDKQYVEAIARVTEQDIMRVAGKYFTDRNSVTATLMPVGTAPETEAERPAAEAAAPEIEKITLPNGLTLLLRDDPGTKTVSVRAVFLGGALLENKSDTGITNLMSKTMLKGTATRSAEEIASAIESRGGSISSFSGYNSFGFEMSMLSGDVETGLTILGDVIASPSFPEQELERERAAALASIKSVSDNIISSSMKLFRHTMFDGHPYGFLVQGEADVVKSITPEELREYHSKVVEASRMVLSVFGNIDRAKIIESVERNFGALKPGTRPSLAAESASLPTRVKQASEQMNKEQLAVFIGFPGITVKDPDRYPLELLSNYLNSQGGKLFQVLRDERGLAYSVGVFNIMGVDPGAFLWYIITVPGKRDEAVKGMFEVIREVRANGVEGEDLERAKAEAMGSHAIELQTNGQIATVASFDELYGLGYDNYREYDDRMRAVTSEDIRRVADRMFDLDRYVLVEVGNLESK